MGSTVGVMRVTKIHEEFLLVSKMTICSYFAYGNGSQMTLEARKKNIDVYTGHATTQVLPQKKDPTEASSSRSLNTEFNLKPMANFEKHCTLVYMHE